MKVFERDKDGNKILDKDGNPKPTKEFNKIILKPIKIVVAICLVASFTTLGYVIFFSDPQCPGCGKVIKEGVGINEDGVLVDGGAKYHDFGCQLQESTRKFMEGVDEQSRILEKQKRLNSGE